MLKHRIIPILLTDGSQCVKPVAFQRPYRKLGTMEQYVQVVERRNVDELMIIDIEPKKEPDYGRIKTLCNNLYCPITIGGSIQTLEHIHSLLMNGADKVAIKTHDEIINAAALKFGSQAIVAVIDYTASESFDFEMIINTAKNREAEGAGEILLQSMARDGLMEYGYDLAIISMVSSQVKIPVIALGGCGEPEHMRLALDAGANAVAAGSMFLYTEHTPRSCTKYLAERGYNVRL